MAIGAVSDGLIDLAILSLIFFLIEHQILVVRDRAAVLADLSMVHYLVSQLSSRLSKLLLLLIVTVVCLGRLVIVRYDLRFERMVLGV